MGRQMKIGIEGATWTDVQHGPNADRWGFTASTAWVVDGATTPSRLRCCALGPDWYANALSVNLQRFARDWLPLVNIVSAAVSEVSSQHATVDPRPCPGRVTPSAAIALCRVGVDKVEYLVLADCTFLCVSDSSVTEVVDQRLERVAVEIRSRYRDARTSGETKYSYALREELVQDEFAARNVDGGYFVASLDPGCVRGALTGSVDLPTSGRAVVALLTDGVDTRRLSSAAESLPDLLRGGIGPADLVAGNSAGSGNTSTQHPNRDDATAVVICAEISNNPVSLRPAS